MKILIVEDDTGSRIYLERALLSQGYTVESASNGLIALEKTEQSAPDLIISDIMMPEMDGFELCRRLKTDNRLRNIPIVFYTATFIEHKDEQLAMSLGASRFLVKPMELEDLFRVIKEIIEEHEKCGLEAPDGLIGNMAALDRMQIEVLARKLDKKVRELDTERDALRASEQKYKRLYESLRDGFAVVDMQGRIQDCNETFATMLGYSKAELSEMTYREITPESWHDFEKKIVEDQVYSRGYSDIYEKEYIKKDGTVIPVELHTFLIRSEAGDNLGMWAIVRDISDRKKSEMERGRLEEHLRHSQKLEGIGQLAGGIAHDFNNVLNAVIGYAELLNMRMAINDPLRQFAEEIISAGQRGVSLTQQILAFSRKQVLDMKPVDINGIIRSLEKMLMRLLRECIEIDIRLSDGELVVLADDSQIDQVLINLITNARDAMPNHGKLTISTEYYVMDSDFVRMHGFGASGEYALIMVSDSGCGMNEETIAHIFEPFFTTKEVGKGTGLGLAVVHGIVKQHNGYINVYSEVGKGTIFRIYLPLTGQTPEAKRKKAEARVVGGTETILMAEDDSSSRKLSSIVLGQYGYAVIEAVDGEDAVRKYAENNQKISLVVLDCIMPKKGGKETLEEIRKINPEAKAVFMSGYTEDILLTSGISDNRVLLVRKPFKPDELARKIREALDEDADRG